MLELLINSLQTLYTTLLAGNSKTVQMYDCKTPLSKGCSRNYPGGHIFFQTPSTPRTHMESDPPDPQDT